jgi:hypothetical protein
MAALVQPEEARATVQETRADRRRIKELEKDLKRKEKALAETTALLVLRKKNCRRSSKRAGTNDFPGRSPEYRSCGARSSPRRGTLPDSF